MSQADCGRRRRLREMGLTLDDYQRLLTAQRGVCKCCGVPHGDGKNLTVHRDKLTSTVYGLICASCAMTLRSVWGSLGTRLVRLRQVANYLEGLLQKDYREG